jgi:hypothetical protein
MELKTLEALRAFHECGIARRIEQISGGQLTLIQGTLYGRYCALNRESWMAPHGASRKQVGV